MHGISPARLDFGFFGTGKRKSLAGARRTSLPKQYITAGLLDHPVVADFRERDWLLAGVGSTARFDSDYDFALGVALSEVAEGFGGVV
jgi:hypothetical protein